MYKRQIAALEQDLRIVEEKIRQVWTQDLVEQRRKILNSLSDFRRRQYEYENEYMDYDDDR